MQKIKYDKGQLGYITDKIETKLNKWLISERRRDLTGEEKNLLFEVLNNIVSKNTMFEEFSKDIIIKQREKIK